MWIWSEPYKALVARRQLLGLPLLLCKAAPQVQACVPNPSPSVRTFFLDHMATGETPFFQRPFVHTSNQPQEFIPVRQKYKCQKGLCSSLSSS